MKQTLTIEVAPFQVANGITEDDVLEASDRIEREFLSTREGYLGRFLARKDANSWADIVLWKTPELAAKAMEAATSSEACRAYFQCMVVEDHDTPDKGVTLFRSMRVYGPLQL